MQKLTGGHDRSALLSNAQSMWSLSPTLSTLSPPGLALNAILVTQILMYAKNTKAQAAKTAKKKKQ